MAVVFVARVAPRVVVNNISNLVLVHVFFFFPSSVADSAQRLGPVCEK